MRKGCSSIVKVVVAILMVLAIVFVVAGCQDNDEECSESSLGARTVTTAAFSPSKAGEVSLAKDRKKGRKKPRISNPFDSNC